VVTGATGFIGTHLLRRLRHSGVPVLAIVRTRPTDDRRDPEVEYVVRDLEQTESLAGVLREGDAIVHLAARVHMMRDAGASSEEAYQRANVETTRMLCTSAADSGARRIVYLSSAKVFGEGTERPYRRTDPLAPADAYARSKVAAETIVRETSETRGLEWTVLRPPFVYGPGGKGNFSRLVWLAKLSTIVPLPFGSIANQRSIVYVENLVDAIVRCGLHARANAQVLLPTDTRDVSTAELLRAIARARAAHARLFPCPPALLRGAARMIGRSAEMDRLTESLRLDARHLADELGWQPPYALDQALERSVGARRRHAGATGDV
jgi:UDP-glucose 4-epimerase